ncbi:hypothetical protein EVAR_18057_1 [Eumeta japonica]|uniref:Uncharacterized protein n=1 Tax=Eumeta variegata TaxID=151549 RepID=A0A4C1XW63_EUMVA|nr:hypothetical protein EVAR_18057_1 [Eumeta japonica]
MVYSGRASRGYMLKKSLKRRLSASGQTVSLNGAIECSNVLILTDTILKNNKNNLNLRHVEARLKISFDYCKITLFSPPPLSPEKVRLSRLSPQRIQREDIRAGGGGAGVRSARLREESPSKYEVLTPAMAGYGPMLCSKRRSSENVCERPHEQKLEVAEAGHVAPRTDSRWLRNVLEVTEWYDLPLGGGRGRKSPLIASSPRLFVARG